MVTTIEAELITSAEFPIVQIVVADIEPDSRVTVTREITGLDPTRIRGAYDAVPNGALLLRDSTPPLGRPIVYVATISPPSALPFEISTAPITPPDPGETDRYGRHYISDPIYGRTVRVDVLADPDERETTAVHSLIRVAGRSTPIPVTDVRSSDAGTLLITTSSTVDQRELERLLAPGTAIVSRHAADACPIQAREVFIVGKVQSRRWGRSGRRFWSLSVAVVDEPDPHTPTPTATLGDLATYTAGQTLGDLALTWDTLLDLARDPLEA